MVPLQINGDHTCLSCSTSGTQRREIEKQYKVPKSEAARCLQLITIRYRRTNKERPSIIGKYVWKLIPSTQVGRALNSARLRLIEARISTAHMDALLIMAYVLNKDQGWIFAHYDYKLGSQQTILYTKLITRRTANEPVDALIRY